MAIGDYRTEFPHFDPATMPAIPEGFTDRSWHNEPMPCFIHEASGVLLWVDFEDPAKREWDDGPRFAAVRMTNRHPEHGWQFDGNEIDLFETDDWDVVLRSLPNFTEQHAN